MTTAIIGTGHIGGALARDLVRGGERVALAAEDEEHAAALAQELGEPASAAPVTEAIQPADVVVLAVWLDTINELIEKHRDQLEGKVVIDPSNPIGFDDDGQMIRTLPEDQSAAVLIAAMLPDRAHYAKAFGTLGADSLANAANRVPRLAVLFYATDDEDAADATERLIATAGFDAVRAGGVEAAARLELPSGDLHQNGGLNGKLLDLEEARAAVAGGAPQ